MVWVFLMVEERMYLIWPKAYAIFWPWFWCNLFSVTGGVGPHTWSSRCHSPTTRMVLVPSLLGSTAQFKPSILLLLGITSSQGVEPLQRWWHRRQLAAPCVTNTSWEMPAASVSYDWHSTCPCQKSISSLLEVGNFTASSGSITFPGSSYAWAILAVQSQGEQEVVGLLPVPT